MPGGMETFVGDHMWFALYLGDSAESDVGAARKLKTLKARCEAIADGYAQGYIWQKDPLTFQLRQAEEVDAREACIAGGLCFGDNVEDEWFATFILAQITRQLPLIAKVEDTDGSFLLIEAADALPRWVDPESAQNRVFLRGGRVHLVPQPASPADFGVLPPGSAHISQGLRAVRTCPQRTLASDPIQQPIDRRLGVYPQHAQESMHHTRCFLPKQILKYMEEDPQAISAAVSCFYLRDPIDMKRCGRMDTFPPSDRIMGPVVLSRCMYAQLKQQQFKPPPAFGRMPTPSSRDYDAHMLGAKLACGFEILASKAPVLDPQRLEDDARFQQFLRGLRHHNYFGDNIQGSKAYREKMEAAKQAFLERSAAAQRVSGHTAHDILQARISRPDLGPDHLPRSVDEQTKRQAGRHATDGHGAGGDDLTFSSTQLAALRLQRRMEAWSAGDDSGGGYVDYTPPAHIREDSDEWMHMEPSEMDRLLSAYQMMTTEAAGGKAGEAPEEGEEGQQGQQQQQQQQHGDEGTRRGVDGQQEGMGKGGAGNDIEATMDEERIQERLRAMADGISQFVDMESGFEGAADLSDFFFEKDLAEEEENDSDDDGDGADDGAVSGARNNSRRRGGGGGEHGEGDDDDVTFDPERFLSGLKDLLRLGEGVERQQAPTKADGMRNAEGQQSKGKQKEKKNQKKVTFAASATATTEKGQRDADMAAQTHVPAHKRRTEARWQQESRTEAVNAEVNAEVHEEDEEQGEDPFADVHAQIEEELKGSFVRHGYVKEPTIPQNEHGHPQRAEVQEEREDGGQDDTPVALDFNLVHNLLQSYGAQQGVAGPASTLLHTTAALHGTTASSSSSSKAKKASRS